MSRFLARILAAAMSRGVRGSSRATVALAWLVPELRAYPMRVGGGAIFLDLRRDAWHHFLMREPCPAHVFEPEVQTAFVELLRADDVLFDIGANFGWYTVGAAPLVREIHAFEPQPSVLPLLRRTIARLPNAALHPIALAAHDGVAVFFETPDQTMSGLRNWVGSGREIAVECRRLDSLRLPQPDVVKVDVEGAEDLVFAGAEGMLNRADAPIVMFEAGPAAAAFSYDRFRARDRLAAMPRPGWNFRYLSGDKWSVRPTGTTGIETVLAVPRSRLDRI